MKLQDHKTTWHTLVKRITGLLCCLVPGLWQIFLLASSSWSSFRSSFMPWLLLLFVVLLTHCSQLYHPDQNTQLSDAWKEIVHHVTQVLLARQVSVHLLSSIFSSKITHHSEHGFSSQVSHSRLGAQNWQ